MVAYQYIDVTKQAYARLDPCCISGLTFVDSVKITTAVPAKVLWKLFWNFLNLALARIGKLLY